MNQIIFILLLIATFTGLIFSFSRIFRNMKLTKPFPIKNIGQRIKITFDVVLGQSKIFRMPLIGLMHALVFWGFLVIALLTIEMTIDGIFGTDRIFESFGFIYNIITATSEIFALIILIAITMFILRRTFFKIKRFEGIEMKPKSHKDAIIALFLIFWLMFSLLGVNIHYCHYQMKIGQEILGSYPISNLLLKIIFGELDTQTTLILLKSNWWFHIILIFIFANYLPYSKHFHVFMSIPNVFLSRLQPLGKLDTMDNITKEVKLMLNPETAFAATSDNQVIDKFGVLDVENITWKNYLDSLACTQCGRCTASCPANITGKKLSPRKIIMNVRERMNEKGPGLVKSGKEFTDQKSLIRDYISEEELWACTTCNACAQECPININHPTLIVDMRRYLVMEESAAPAGLNTVFQNIENNGAIWQFSAQDRMIWAENIKIKDEIITVPILSELITKGRQPEYLLWVSSAGAFDDRFKKVMKEFVKILHYFKIDYAVLGIEESDSGDIARRAGNEMLFQMQALSNIEILNGYGIKKIITCDPHDYNSLKNEYPDLGGNYEVIHHSQFLSNLIKTGKINNFSEYYKNDIITFHDPCYLGRANKEYNAPRDVIKSLGSQFIEMKRNKSFALCCGAGGGQMFKEAEKGDKEVFIERIEDAIDTKCTIVATACPFCMTMMTDGIKYKNLETKMKCLDIAELIVKGLNI
jgi:Fe-S oxidoreductase